MINKKEYLILILIFISGFTVRTLKFGDIAVGTDVSAFARLGKNFIESGSYSFGENYNMGVFFPPGYPLFIGIMNLLLNDLFLSAKLVSFISSMLTIPIFYFIGKELYNNEAGLFAAFAYALYPLSIILGAYGNSDALFFCLFFLASYVFLLSLTNNGILFYVLLGILAGMATITRPEGMFLCSLPFLHVFGLFGEKPSSARKFYIGIAIMLSIFIMILSPYMLFVKNYTGKFALSGKNNIAVLLAELSNETDYHHMVNAPKNLYDEAAFSLMDGKKQLTGWNREIQRSLLKDYILKDPVKFIKGYLKKVQDEITVLLKLFLPFLIPLVILLSDKTILKEKAVLVYILLPIIYFLMYPFFVIIERQTFFIVLFPLVLSSIGFVNSRSAITQVTQLLRVKNNRIGNFAGNNIKIIIIVIFVFASFIYLTYSSFDKVPIPVEHAKAGHFIRTSISTEYEKVNVMSRKPIVSFYSGARFTMLPYASSKDVLDFAKLYDVDYIVIDERLLSQWDFYDELLLMDKHFDDVVLIYEDQSGKRIKLFEIK